MRNKGCEINYWILAIAYLEALIWITVLISSAGGASRTPEDTSYLVRETGNLKSTVVVYSSDSLPVIADLPGADFHQIQEDQALQHLFSTQEALRTILHRPQLLLSFLPVLKGVPAPFSGINALSALLI